MKDEFFEIANHIETNFDEYEDVILTDYQNKVNYKRIISKLKTEQENRNMRVWKIGKKIAVAGLVVALGFASATTVAFASEGKVFNYLYTFLNGSGITYQEKNGISSTTIDMNATENPPVELVNEKMYFTADGGKTDITNLISDEIPYIAEYMDEQGNTHKFIIGGAAVAESYGFEESIFNQNGKFVGASGYFGSNIEGVGSGIEPVWLVEGRKQIGR